MLNVDTKKQKIFFLLTSLFYIITIFIMNFTSKSTEILNSCGMKNISNNSKTTFILIATIINMFILLVILIIARFLLIMAFRFIYKNNDHRDLLNQIYFVSISLKLIFLIIGQITFITGSTFGKILINAAVIILYILYVFISKTNMGEQKLKKERIVQAIAGISLILFV